MLEHHRPIVRSLAVAGALAVLLSTGANASLSGGAPQEWKPGELRFHFGEGYGGEIYRANHDSLGIPKAMDPTTTPVSADLMQRIALVVPEGKDIRATGNAALVADSESSTLSLRQDADIWMTFLHEGAGYRNTVGYYAYPAGDPPQSREEVEYAVVWPNASYSTSGGSTRGLKTGQQVYLGRFAAGTKIGFFAVANGFDSTVGAVDRYRGWVWHSLQALNMESNPLLRAHMILLRDETNEQFVLGIEDINREANACDQDFNDVMVSIQANPFEAIATEKIAELIDPADPDGDGVMSSDDDYPDDPLRALRVTYPNDRARAQLAFEDMWPSEGDYDLNDLVLAYTLTEVRDAQGNIRDLEGSFRIKARGAGYSHGFGLHFPNLPPEVLESASIWVDEQPSRPLEGEVGQGRLTLILIEDSLKLADRNVNTRTCFARKFNADPNCAELPGPTIGFQATFAHALTREELGPAPYNPFVYIVGDRGRETHLADALPTDKVIAPGVRGTRFGTRDDGYLGTDPRYYKTRRIGTHGGLPWAMNVPQEWRSPLEKRSVNECYPGLVDWINSGGTRNTDWYRSGIADCVFPFAE